MELLKGRPLDVESIAPALAGVTTVFHCSPGRWPGDGSGRRSPETTSDVDGTRNLLIAMTRAGVDELVHLGSAFSFGGGTMEDPGTEETAYAGEAFGLPCLDSARAAQELVLRFAGDGKVRCVVLNPTLMLGPGDGAPSAALFRWVRSGARAFPPGGINVVDARDVARAAIRAAGRGRPGQCYVLGSENLTYRELLVRVAAAMGLPAPDHAATERSMLLRARTASTLRRLFGRRPVIDRGVARLAASEMYYSSEKAARELGFSPSPVDGALLLQSR